MFYNAGTPAEMYVYGTEYWLISIGYCLLFPAAAHIFIPVFYRLKLTSVFQVTVIKTTQIRFHFIVQCKVIHVLCDYSPHMLNKIFYLCSLLPNFLQYLEMRFNRTVRMMCAMCFIVQMVSSE